MWWGTVADLPPIFRSFRGWHFFLVSCLRCWFLVTSIGKTYNNFHQEVEKWLLQTETLDVFLSLLLKCCFISIYSPHNRSVTFSNRNLFQSTVKVLECSQISPSFTRWYFLWHFVFFFLPLTIWRKLCNTQVMNIFRM